MTSFIDGMLLHSSDLEQRFAQYLATGTCSAAVLAVLGAPDAATIRAILGVGTSSVAGTDGQVLYNKAGTIGAFSMGGDVTLNASTGAVTIGNNVVTNAKLGNMLPYSLKMNATGVAAQPVDGSLGGFLDAAYSNMRGAVLVRTGAKWSAITGSAGQVLTSGGTTADPSFTSYTGGNSDITISTPTGGNFISQNSTAPATVGVASGGWLARFMNSSSISVLAGAIDFVTTAITASAEAGYVRVRSIFNGALVESMRFGRGLFSPNASGGDMGPDTINVKQYYKDGAALGLNVLPTQATTSGTYVDFTFPAGAKRITVLFNGVSTNGTALLQVQIGNTTPEATGYISYGNIFGPGGATGNTTSSTGFVINLGAATDIRYGRLSLYLTAVNTWAEDHSLAQQGGYISIGGGQKITSGAVNIVRVTMQNGTDQFDAGSVSVLAEY